MASYAPIGQASFSSTPYTYSPLLSDGDDVVSRSASMASGGGVQKRGTILKYDPATGLITIPVATTDCNAILVNDIDATAAAAAALIYVGGKFKADALLWPGALSHALCTESLRMHDIQVESVVFTDGTLVKAQSLDAEAQAAQQVIEYNKGEEDAARSAGRGRGAKEGTEPPAKPTMDSPWAYLTAEEREKNPELAQVPTVAEIGDAMEGAGQPATVTLSPTSDSMSATAETSNFQVNMSGPGTWTAVADPAKTWLTVVGPTGPQSADGTVTYAVAANTGAARNSTITVNGKTFTVTQSGSAF
jgi:hypothetical protein